MPSGCPSGLEGSGRLHPRLPMRACTQMAWSHSTLGKARTTLPSVLASPQAGAGTATLPRQRLASRYKLTPLL